LESSDNKFVLANPSCVICATEVTLGNASADPRAQFAEKAMAAIPTSVKTARNEEILSADTFLYPVVMRAC
jgi:hypothetical protein